MKFINKLRKWIRSGNDCEHCPAGWSECCYTDCGTEYDGGCYIYGDEWPEPCRLMLPPFLRAFLARRPKYLHNHRWDNYGDWCEKKEAGTEIIRDILEKELDNRCICWKDDNGQYLEVNTDSYIHDMAWKSQLAYDDFISKPHKTLRQKWAELIKETFSISILLDFVKSYIAE